MKIDLCILPNRPRIDGTYSVKIKIYNNFSTAYITTDIAVRAEQWKNGLVVDHNEKDKFNERLKYELMRIKVLAKPFSHTNWTGTRIKGAILSDKYEEIISKLPKLNDNYSILSNSILETASINSYKLEIESLSERVKQLQSVIHFAKTSIDTFVTTPGLRKRDIKKLTSISDHLSLE